jgi:hypothetical protein
MGHPEGLGRRDRMGHPEGLGRRDRKGHPDRAVARRDSEHLGGLDRRERREGTRRRRCRNRAVR